MDAPVFLTRGIRAIFHVASKGTWDRQTVAGARVRRHLFPNGFKRVLPT